jgi:hypothetical protein
MLFKNSVRTSKRTPHFTITKINWLTLFKEMIADYTENHTKLIKYEILAANGAGTYNNHWALQRNQRVSKPAMQTVCMCGSFRSE